MRVQSDKFDINALQPPIRLVRATPKPKEPRAAPAAAAPAAPDGAAPKEKLDTSKIAPWGGAVKNRQNLFKKKTKTFFFSSDFDSEVGKDGEELTHAQKKRLRDPDRWPWLLSDFPVDGQSSQNQYLGHVEQSQEARYVMFVQSTDGFKVVPVTRSYKFTKKPSHRTLTIEETEDLYKEDGKKSRVRVDRWMMHKQPAKPGQVREAAEDGGQQVVPKWERSIQEAEERQYKQVKSRGRGRRQDDGDVDEMDYDVGEEFADDEEVVFGLSDEDEKKEAARRLHHDDGDMDSDEEEKKPKIDKKLKKVLKKAGNDDLFGDDDENPYLSEPEESEEDEEQKAAEADKEKSEAEKEGSSTLGPKAKGKKDKGKGPAVDKKGKGRATPSGGSSPMRPSTPPRTPTSAQVKLEPKKRDGSMSPRGASGRSGSRSPLPPSGGRSPQYKHQYSPKVGSPLGAGETAIKAEAPTPIVKLTIKSPAPPATEETAKRKRDSIEAAAGVKKVKREPGSIPSPARSGGGTPSSRNVSSPAGSTSGGKRSGAKATPPSSSSGSPSTPGRLLTEQDVINVLRAKGGAMAVKDIIGELKVPYFVGQFVDQNKGNFRAFMKRVGHHDKDTQRVTLKPEYMDVKMEDV
ncbi:hypothetical protein HDV00_010882 [Rhizophlyctis rosea]|nr:hypothetical protein HDV00_010882 [Rhizophlyctis rosea]